MAEFKPNGTASKIETFDGTEDIPKWFCMAISPSATIFKATSDSIEGFRDRINEAAIAWVDYIAQDFDRDVPVVASELGFSSQLACSFIGDSYITYQDFDTEMGLKVPSVQVRQFEVEGYPLLLLIRKNFIFTIHPFAVDRRFLRLRRYAETVLKKIPIGIPPEDKLTLLLTRLIDENNDRNFEHLREIDERGDTLNKSMSDPNVPRDRLGPEIYQMKHALIVYLNALWDTVNVLHTIRYGDAELITNDQPLLDKIGVLAEDVNRQIGLAEHMSDVLASGLEVLQTIYNNQLQSLNNRLALIMTYLTIVGTAVLIPNTLATMLGNAVFNIGPQDLGWYLALMIGSTVIGTGLVYWWVRRRGWLKAR
ncbi:MAG: CorA family divalent cation transporter [Chloroflexota bacterium]